MFKRLPFLVGIGALTMPMVAFAQAGGAAGLATFINNFVLANGLTILQGLAAGFMFYYGFRMVMESGDEAAIGNARKSFINALIGFAVLAAGEQIRTALFIGSTGTVNPIPFHTAPIISQLEVMRTYLIQTSEGILLVMFVYAAFKLMTSGGDESAASNARKNMVHYGAAAMIMMISVSIVHAFFYQEPAALIVDIAGIVRFALGVLGAASVIAMVVAGIMLIISIDESYRDKAKQMVIGTLISMLIALFGFAIITAFINGIQVP